MSESKLEVISVEDGVAMVSESKQTSYTREEITAKIEAMTASKAELQSQIEVLSAGITDYETEIEQWNAILITL